MAASSFPSSPPRSMQVTIVTGPAKRRRRPSAEEGPTIYKCDQLRQMLEAALRNRSKRNASTDLVKFLGGHLPVRTDANGKSRLTGDDDENPSTARFHSFCKQLAEALGLSKDFVQDRITQGLLHDEAQLKELCDHLTAASEHYGLAMSLIKDEPLNRPVTIRIGTTNLINMRVLPLVLEAVRQKFRTQFPDVQLRFVQTIMDSDELLFGNQPLVGVDAVVACCLKGRVGKIPVAELAASMPLRCCLLRSRTDIAAPLAARALNHWDELRGTDMVALASRRKHFDVPWGDVEATIDTMEEVPTLLEAHARVAASDAWTLSYRELMDDVDEQRLEALDLPPDSERQVPLIVAVLPQGKRASSRGAEKSDGIGLEKNAALSMLKECLQLAFQQRLAMQKEAEELTSWLSRFPYSYHVSDYTPQGSSGSERTWIAGRAHLECTSNGNLTGFLGLGIPVADPLQMRVFGKPIRYQDGSVWHLQWRTVDQVAQSGTTNLVVSKAALKEGSVLVGSWMGRSSWLPDEIRPSGGPFVLHTQPDLTARELKRIVESHRDLCIPNLREVATEIVPLTVVTISSAQKSAVKRKASPGKPR
jgi:hypothetical protein